jgi:hypothetical protein
MRAFRRPSNGMQTGVQTGVKTPFRRCADGIQTDYSHTPHTPQARGAPLWGLWKAPGRSCAGVVALRRKTVRSRGAE